MGQELELFPLSDPSSPKAGAVLFLRERQPPSPLTRGEDLRRRFGLTLAEEKVAMALAEGLALKQIAVRLGVSINTVRFHLAHVFDKTDTRRQVQLVRLILSLE